MADIHWPHAPLDRSGDAGPPAGPSWERAWLDTRIVPPPWVLGLVGLGTLVVGALVWWLALVGCGRGA